MRVLELIHDEDSPEISNIDLWLAGKPEGSTKKLFLYQRPELPSLDSFDLLFLHGGVQHIWDKDADPWLYREIEFVRECIHKGKPVIGFCLGTQIIADAMRGRVYKTPVKEAGWYTIKLNLERSNSVLVNGLGDCFESFLWHEDHYDLPPHFYSLGNTLDAANQIIASDIYPAVGYQFHPEYTKEIIRYYARVYKDDLWQDIDDVGKRDNFMVDLEVRNETLTLFTQLMDRTGMWFEEKFKIKLY